MAFPGTTAMQHPAADPHRNALRPDSPTSDRTFPWEHVGFWAVAIGFVGAPLFLADYLGAAVAMCWMVLLYVPLTEPVTHRPVAVRRRRALLAIALMIAAVAAHLSLGPRR